MSAEEQDRTQLRAQFTPREHEVLLLMAKGLDNKAIARELGLTLNTVRSYVHDILEKLDAHSRRWPPPRATTCWPSDLNQAALDGVASCRATRPDADLAEDRA